MPLFLFKQTIIRMLRRIIRTAQKNYQNRPKVLFQHIKFAKPLILLYFCCMYFALLQHTAKQYTNQSNNYQSQQTL